MSWLTYDLASNMGTAFLVVFLFIFHFQKSHQYQTVKSSLYTSTLVNGSFVTINSMVADTLIDCVAQCQTHTTCSVVEFTDISKSCNSLERYGLGLVSTGGVQVYVDATQPSK